MFLILVILLLFLGLFIFVMVKINNLRYRATQHIFGKVGLGASDLNRGLNNVQEKTSLPKFLMDYPFYTEVTLKDSLYQISYQILNNQNNGYMSDKVLSKMNSDKRLLQMRTMNFVRLNVIGYLNGNKLVVSSVFTDGKDEYQLILNVLVHNNLLYIESYDSVVGMVKGF